LLGVIMNERKPLRLENIQTDPRSSGFPPHHPPMHTLLGVPIQVGAYLFGLLYLSDKIDGTQFTDEDQLLVETLAGYASLAIAGVQLSEQQSRVSVLEERERIGMELHDSVIQSLYAIGMELQLMKSDADPSLDLDSPIRHLDNVIGEIRQYILNLKASTSHRTTIRDSITAVFERLHIPPHLHVIIDAPDEYPPLESHTFEAACQICSEVASNAIRHANATELYVAARKERSTFVMIIKDNGSGFDVNAVEKGLGLTNITRRAQLLSGNVSIRSFPGEGTQITLTLPLR
jgi:signal transduction histidine kinase